MYHIHMLRSFIKKLHKHKIKLLPVVLVGLFILSASVTAVFLRKKQPVSKPVAQQSGTVTFSTDKPDEKKPDKNTYKWNGTPKDPKFIRIPKISVDGFLQNVGVDQNNAIAVPNNIHVAGWFNQSVSPGQNGLSIIDGHVDGRVVKEGVFSQISKLVAGDSFTIEFGDGSVKNFTVKKNVSVLTQDAAAVLFSQEPGIAKQLNLISCIGTYISKSKTYDHRQIVIAEAM